VTSTLTFPIPHPCDAARREPTPVTLAGLGAAVPALVSPQSDVADELASAWGLTGRALERWRRIVEGSEIDTRHAVQPIAASMPLSTKARMDAYEREAPPLAADAARAALADAGVSAHDVTDLIVVSCTGFSAPGVDVELIERLGLSRSVRRTLVGFMGCFGAISGMRTAVGAGAANPGAVALVVCVELCSLHVRPEPDVQNQVASALFADGAAAAVLTSRPSDPTSIALSSATTSRSASGLLVTTGASLVISDGRDWMTWRVTDAGFAMTLTRDVPAALRTSLAGFVRESSPTPPASFAIHPGGAAILDAADDALGCRGGRGLVEARGVLRRRGNMSSPTVLFVLQDLLSRGGAPPINMLAFGPGLTMESVTLLPGAD